MNASTTGGDESRAPQLDHRAAAEGATASSGRGPLQSINQSLMIRHLSTIAGFAFFIFLYDLGLPAESGGERLELIRSEVIGCGPGCRFRFGRLLFQFLGHFAHETS